MNPEETDQTIETETTEDTDAVVGDMPTIIDLVMDGKASEAKEAIFASLYQKVGEKIDALRPEIRASVNIAGKTSDSNEEESN
jgi:hypothetical protein